MQLLQEDLVHVELHGPLVVDLVQHVVEVVDHLQVVVLEDHQRAQGHQGQAKGDLPLHLGQDATRVVSPFC